VKNDFAVAKVVFQDRNATYIMGQSLLFGGNDSYVLKSVSTDGQITYSPTLINSDGVLLIITSPEFSSSNSPVLSGSLFSATTGQSLTSISIMMADTFEDWFKKYKKIIEGSTPPKDGRPVLYNYDWLKEHFGDLKMVDGDYFPSWEDKDYTLEKNLEFIKNLVKGGKPIGDSYIDGEGNLLTPPKDSTLEKERKIITDGGYKWNKDKRQWEKS
jgi:hypothetical protein